MISAKGVLLWVLGLQPDHGRRGWTGLGQERLTHSREGVKEEEAQVDECCHGGLAVQRELSKKEQAAMGAW